MAIERQRFVDELQSAVRQVLADIEERDMVDGDLALARELAEQLLEEVDSLE